MHGGVRSYKHAISCPLEEGLEVIQAPELVEHGWPVCVRTLQGLFDLLGMLPGGPVPEVGDRDGRCQDPAADGAVLLQ